MAFDGTVIAALKYELNNKLIGGRITKISQPEKDELLITIKNNKNQYRLLISAGASLPLMYLTHNNKPAPLSAPNFCMLLRKHIGNGKITSIDQPGLERIINIHIEHLNELGDMCQKTLVVELMGKHSNIIFCEENKIIDSIKRISASVSSVRSVLPGCEYFIPNTNEKLNPLTTKQDDFLVNIKKQPFSIGKAIFTMFTGISPILSEEILYSCQIDSSIPVTALNEEELIKIYNFFNFIISKINSNDFNNRIYYENKLPKDFSAMPLRVYSDLEFIEKDSTSEILELYFSQKNSSTRIRQKSSDLRQIVNTLLQKDYKKYDIQLKQIKDTEKKDKFKVYGELISAYGYSLKDGAKELKAIDYYSNNEVTIPLDPEISPIDNAKKYFNKYTKLKRTYDALSTIIKDTKSEIDHLESISNSLEIAESDSDLNDIKEELMDYNYIRRKKSDKKTKSKNKPLHYISSDGFHMYVGKNNFQNEEITFKLATGNDWWFHSKGIPGSHVIVKTQGNDLPDNTFEEAASLAAYYSKGRNQEKVEIDYVEKKHLKKPSGAKPGFVIYHTNYSMAIKPDISNIELYKES